MQYLHSSCLARALSEEFVVECWKSPGLGFAQLTTKLIYIKRLGILSMKAPVYSDKASGVILKLLGILFKLLGILLKRLGILSKLLGIL